jgi:hypothetical protein
VAGFDQHTAVPSRLWTMDARPVTSPVLISVLLSLQVDDLSSHLLIPIEPVLLTPSSGLQCGGRSFRQSVFETAAAQRLNLSLSHAVMVLNRYAGFDRSGCISRRSPPALLIVYNMGMPGKTDGVVLTLLSRSAMSRGLGTTMLAPDDGKQHACHHAVNVK